MAECYATRAEKEQWEQEILEFLVRFLKDKTPATLAEAVVQHMIETGDFWPYDLIESSVTDYPSWEALQYIVRWLKENSAVILISSPLLDWAVDVADGTRTPPKRAASRPKTARSLFRDTVIVGVILELNTLGLRTADANCHLVAKTIHHSYEGVRNIWQRHRRSQKKGAGEKKC